MGFMSYKLDISELKRKERETTEALKELAKIERLRAEEAEELHRQQEGFIDTVCHEIRNPLNGIMHCTDFVRECLENMKQTVATGKELDSVKVKLSTEIESALEECGSITLCSKHQKAIADDVLHLSKLTANMMHFDLSDFLAVELVQQVSLTFKAQLLEKKIFYETEFRGLLATDPSQTLIGDRVRITQVFINILTNAIKFTQNEANRKIKVVADMFEKQEYGAKVAFRITVEDSGIGITEEQRATLFRKFQQASVKTYSEYGGSGLGLFISKNIITAMGGEVQVESMKGKGTSFSFIIPLARGSEIQPLLCKTATVRKFNPPDTAVVEAARGKTILIVDDNDINRKILTKILKTAGFETLEADNGLKACELSAANPIAMIFMDIEMPVMDGKVATQKIREREELEGTVQFIPIVAVTGNARVELVKEMIELGMQAVIVKPFKPTQ
ncbi:hypothetical protein HDU98_006686 [Podochytrium sp. JEL0797]|nr:hypothetical protein HDU98_006686 [Podochytrium sp. JEL0797]